MNRLLDAAMDSRRERLKAWLLLSCILAASFVLRWQFRHVDMFRDEGEYCLMAQRILQGDIPYQDLYNQKTPFTFYLLAAVQFLFGESLLAFRLATTFYGWLTMAAVFGLALRLFGLTAAGIATAALSLMSIDQAAVYYQGSTEYFMLLWFALAVWFWELAKEEESPWFAFFAGLAAGMAFETKQTGIVVLAYFVIESLWRRWLRKGRGFLFPVFSGFAMVVGLVLLYFALHGALRAFVECVWVHNAQYVGLRHSDPNGIGREWFNMLLPVARSDLFLWISGAAGLVLAGLRREGRGQGLWLLLLLSVVTVTAAGPLYHYYLILAVPLALGNGIAGSWLLGRFLQDRAFSQRLLLGACMILPWTLPFWHNLSLLRMQKAEIQRPMAYWLPSAYSQRLGKYLAQRTKPDETLQVIGSLPELYFYAGRKPASRMVITFPMTGPYAHAPKLRAQYFADLESHPPRYMILVALPWLLTEWPEIPPEFSGPIRDMLKRRYRPESVGTVAGPDGFDEYELARAGIFLFRLKDSPEMPVALSGHSTR